MSTEFYAYFANILQKMLTAIRIKYKNKIKTPLDYLWISCQPRIVEYSFVRFLHATYRRLPKWLIAGKVRFEMTNVIGS